MHSEIRQQLETYTESFQILSYNRYGRYRQTLADRKINKLREIPCGDFSVNSATPRERIFNFKRTRGGIKFGIVSYPQSFGRIPVKVSFSRNIRGPNPTLLELSDITSTSASLPEV
jgi:hypothetical protein